MLKFNRPSQVDHPLHLVAAKIGTALAERGNALRNPNMTEAVMSLESLDDGRWRDFTSHADQIGADIVQFFKEAEISTEGYTQAQMKSGTIALMAAGKPGDYAKKAMTVSRARGGDNITVFETSPGAYSDFDFRAQPAFGIEAFDDRELLANLPFSVVFNIQAARQNEFGESFYPTVVMTPDQAAIDISVRRTMVFNEIRHEITGKPMDFKRRNLIEAVIDHTLLTENSTDCVPVWITGNADNNAKFNTDVAVSQAKVGSDMVDTRPLKPGIEINVLGLSQNPSVLATGQLDNTDSLDNRVALKTVYLRVEALDPVTPTDPHVISYIPISTESLPRALFHPATEGYDREVMLNFVSDDLPIHGATKDVTDVAAPALAYFAQVAYENHIIRLKATVTGQGNLETGNFNVNPIPVTIDKIVERDPVTFDLTEVTGSALTTLKSQIVSISVVGYDLAARRSNLNRRTRGLQVTTVEQSERFTIPLLAPITCPNPVTNTRTATDMAAPITAARIINDNNAVTKLLQYADTLEAHKLSQTYLVASPTVEGVGRHVIKPYFDRQPLDLSDVVASIKSTERADDVSAAIVNKIRTMVYKAYLESGYQPALDAATGGTAEKPKLLIGTDPNLLRHIMVTGDTRTASIAFEHKIVSTYDKRMKNKIVMVFRREGLAGPDPLDFGFMAWMPELATNVQVTRNGAVVTETMVQPRAKHINTCPIMMVIDVSNLAAAVADQMPVRTDEV